MTTPNLSQQNSIFPRLHLILISGVGWSSRRLRLSSRVRWVGPGWFCPCNEERMTETRVVEACLWRMHCSLLGFRVCCLVARNTHMTRNPLHHHFAGCLHDHECFSDLVRVIMHVMLHSAGIDWLSEQITVLPSYPEDCFEQSAPLPWA